MHTIQVTSGHSENADLMFSFCTRTALLFATTHTEIGRFGNIITRRLVEKEMTANQKIKMLKMVAESQEEEEKEIELIEIINNFFDFEKKNITNKHPSREIFSTFKSFEYKLMKVYEEWSKNATKFIEENSFDEFQYLFKHKVFDAYGLFESEVSRSSKDNVMLHPYHVFSFASSKLNHPQPIWLLPYQFYSYTFLKNFYASLQEVFDSLQQDFIEITYLKNINLLKHIDIENIKKQLAPQLQTCNKQLEFWANDCYENNGANLLLPFLKNISDTYINAIQNNDLLQRFEKLVDNDSSVKLFAGEVNYLDLIEFYVYEKEISEQLKFDLMEWYSQQKPFKIPVLIFAITPTTSEIIAASNENNEEALAPKKYLDID